MNPFYRGYMEVYMEPGEELDDIQWLKAKYGNMLDREGKMLNYVMEILGDFNHRLAVIEEKLGEG